MVPRPPKDKMTRKPCVGMCYRTGSNGDEFAELRKQRRERRARKKPCIGLCYIAKRITTSTISPEIENKYGETDPDE